MICVFVHGDGMGVPKLQFWTATFADLALEVGKLQGPGFSQLRSRQTPICLTLTGNDGDSWANAMMATAMAAMAIPATTGQDGQP